MTILEQFAEAGRVAVIRLRSLGDCVLTTPALALLKRSRPDLAIGVAVDDPFKAVFEANPNINELIAPTWQAVRNWKSSLCVNLHGGTRSQWMTALSGAKWRAGFAHHKMAFAYNVKIKRAQRILGVNRIVHTAEHLAAAFAVPSVVLFSSSNPTIWGPWRTESEIIVAPDRISKISVSRVIAAIERLRLFAEAHA